MDQDDSLTRLQGLQADLVAFSESRLLNVDRLWTELEDSIADFRKLLDRQNKNDRSRQALKAGTLVKTRLKENAR
jgi:nuclear pore complex protein Nup205